MMRRAPVLSIPLLLAGCAAPPMDIEDNTRQLDGYQVRTLDAGPQEAFSAVSSAIIDAGYTLRLSDPDGGLLTATMETAPAAGNEVLFRLMSYGLAGAPTTPCWITAQVTPLSDRRSAVRLVQYETGLGGHPKTRDQIMVFAERQVLMKAPPPSR